MICLVPGLFYFFLNNKVAAFPLKSVRIGTLIFASACILLPPVSLTVMQIGEITALQLYLYYMM